MKVNGAVSFLLPVAENAVAERHRAAALELGLGIDNFLLERRYGQDDLEGGARGVLSLNGPIIEWVHPILPQSAPFLRSDSSGEDVGVEGRSAHRGQNRPAVDFQGYNRPNLSLQGFIGSFLNVAVQSKIHTIARDIFHLVQHSYAPPKGIDLHLLSSVPPAQELLPSPL